MNKHPHLSKVFLGCAFALSTQAFAGGFTQTQGALSTLGKVSHPGTIMSIKNNPAAGELLIGQDEKVRLGFASFGYHAELGAVDNFIDDAEALADALEEDLDSFDQADQLKADFDALLPQLGADGRLTQQGSFQLLPVAFRSETFGGVFSFDLGVNGQLDAKFLDDPLSIAVINQDQINLITNSSIYIKSAVVATASVGYSRNVWESENGNNKLYAGATVNFHQIGLNKQLLALQNFLEDQDVAEAIEDEFDQNSETTSAVGIDLGFLWTTPNAQIGVTVLNANEPEADYGTIGENCSQLDNAARQSNCFIAQQSFSDRIALTETAIMTAKTVVEVGFHTEDKAWAISAAADANSTYDLIGRESQYVSVSASYSSDGYFLPSIRFGASKNLVGSELTTVSLGATLFGMANLDLTFSPEMVDVDGTEVPRVFGFSLGMEEKF